MLVERYSASCTLLLLMHVLGACVCYHYHYNGDVCKH